MEAQLVSEIPHHGRWQYEPKWDGFRCLAFRDGDRIELRSKSGQPLERYFPEVVAALRAVAAQRFVLDGELVVQDGEQFAFDLLLQRIHPAATRIKKLAGEYPALLIAFDLLVNEHGDNLVDQPIEIRRRQLEQFAARYFSDNPRLALSPASTDYAQAKAWWKLVGQGLDGLVAKELGVPYGSGHRKSMVKAKKMRTADCVVGGFRYAEKSPVVGSLLLGLYDDQGLLNHVGFTSSLKALQRKELVKLLTPLIEEPGFTGSKPGGPSRWSTTRSAEWEPLKPVLVVEVQYDHFTDRFRHGTKLLRFRPDKNPQDCTYAQVLRPVRGSAALLQWAS